MLHRVGMASSFAIAASLLSGIAAIASTTGPTVISALPARASTPTAAATRPASTGSTQNGTTAPLAGSAATNPTPSTARADAKAVAALFAAAASGGHSVTTGVTPPGSSPSGTGPAATHQPGSDPEPVQKAPTPTTSPPPSTSPTTAPAASPPPFNCAGSDGGMTEAYKHAREQYCQGGGD